MKSYEQAFAEYTKAIELAPEFPLSYLNRYGIRDKSGAFFKAWALKLAEQYTRTRIKKYKEYKAKYDKATHLTPEKREKVKKALIKYLEDTKKRNSELKNKSPIEDNEKFRELVKTYRSKIVPEAIPVRPALPPGP